jgi:hypothetical protein
MKIRSLAIANLLIFSSLANAGSTLDLTRDNEALILHIKATDDVFVKLLGSCSSERLTRAKGGNFTYFGNCQIKPLPETDCQRYFVTAIGTVDNKTWVTVRDIRLSLQCAA